MERREQLCEALVRRAHADAQARYRRPKDADRAARREMHRVAGGVFRRGGGGRADEEGLTRSEYLRYVARMVADDAENAKRGGVLLDGLSMRRLSRELVRWGHHYNQGVHALNSIKFALDHGRGDLEWVSSKLDECALLLAQVDEGRCEMAGELASLEGRAIVGGD